MTKKKKIIIICSILFVILLFVFGFIGFKKDIYEENNVKIEITVLKFLFIARANAKVTNLSDKPLTYDGRSSCDMNPLKISGNPAFTTTYKKMERGTMSCATVITPMRLEKNESFKQKATFFKTWFSLEPIYIVASFKEQHLMGIGSSLEQSNSPSKEKEEPFFITTSVSFWQ